MVNVPYPIETLGDAGQRALASHLFCLDVDEVPEPELGAISRQYLTDESPGKGVVLDLLGATKRGDAWSFERKNAAKRVSLQDARRAGRAKIAFINGREDEGHALKRYKEELARKGVEWDEYWLDQVSLGTSGLAGFPLDRGYAWVILANPEPLEADSAPAFLLKSSIVEAIEARCPVFPARLADATARSKLATLLALSKAGVPTPETIVTASITDAARFVQLLHARGKDVVIKPIAKGGGWGVGKIPRGTSEGRIIDILGKYKWWYGDGVLLLQEFIENKGYDKRVLVLGDLVIGTERRFASLGAESWIYNISRGATGARDELDKAELHLVMAAASATGQLFCGVDLIRGIDGRDYILEVNSTPGFKGFEHFLNINVASFVLDYLLFFR
ncbi:MAG: ATP-grasp domain-containing protein [Candidatus Lokiarchaeota archaeon]|nr:ATP-grasp domain-containing protein [Candidatus Lokiarchaeota archaeon]